MLVIIECNVGWNVTLTASLALTSSDLRAQNRGIFDVNPAETQLFIAGGAPAPMRPRMILPGSLPIKPVHRAKATACAV